jgi:hypothetical protein
MDAKIPNEKSKTPYVLKEVDIEVSEYFITNSNINGNSPDKSSVVYNYTVNILKAFMFPLFIVIRVFTKESNALSIFSIALIIFYFAAFSAITYVLFTNVMVKDGTTQSIELIRNIIFWNARMLFFILIIQRG